MKRLMVFKVETVQSRLLFGRLLLKYNLDFNMLSFYACFDDCPD